MTCTMRPALEEIGDGVYRWGARCGHGRFVSGCWGPRTRDELEALSRLEAGRRRRLDVDAGIAYPPVIGGPWVDRGNELQGAYHLAQLRGIWQRCHELVAAVEGPEGLGPVALVEWAPIDVDGAVRGYPGPSAGE